MGDPEGSEGGARVYLQAHRVALDCVLCGNDLTLPPGFKVRALFREGRGLVPGRAIHTFVVLAPRKSCLSALLPLGVS